MSKIALLSQDTIDKIAAGEVIERPASVVKELVENAIDANATAITVEIKEGGISFIRISDNGFGIDAKEVPLAFLRHSTSKIRNAEDLLCIASLGFRGEALSSIAAVSRVELITKTPAALTGVRYAIEGSKEPESEEIGAPDGTTFLVKDLFYNTPARRKFLKTAQTEGSYIADMVEKLALSHPDISFKYIQNNQTKLHTSGNGNIKDLIYQVFGREFASSILPVDIQNELFSVKGYIGKPIINRGNRNFEIYFINGRYIKSSLLSKSIEEAYKGFLMQHQYPFCVLYFEFKGEMLDVNVHPTKMELRFDSNIEIYKKLCEGLKEILSKRELIPEVPVTEEKKQNKAVSEYKESIPEPFEKRRLNDIRNAVSKDSPYEIKYPQKSVRLGNQVADKGKTYGNSQKTAAQSPIITQNHTADSKQLTDSGNGNIAETSIHSQIAYEEITLDKISPDFLTKDARKKHRIIGQLFKTYWLVEYEEKLFVIDQHAAHEKVLYERTMAALKEKQHTSQMLSPPIVLSLDSNEILMLEKYRPQLERMGYEVESFGGKEYMISAVPANLYHVDMKDLFIEMLDDFYNLSQKATPELILEKIASMSCKAAVKGNQTLSYQEFDALAEELLSLENPYNCPHGRPTIISMSKYEIEKKFKRIV
uniref:DNA mismatch repair endonuclease MutL n=1 Tax=Agathobacter sp. TaxID=2021311 RepID=UPI004055DF05